jgi:lysozyme
MQPSDALLDFVKGWEGLRLEAYLDGGGVPTIGYGRTYNVKLGDTCTAQEAEGWLSETLARMGRSMSAYLMRETSQQQFDALLSLCFNAGVAAIGVSGLMRLHNEGMVKECADRFLLWNKDNGKMVPGLSKRRAAERAIYLNGDYSIRP